MANYTKLEEYMADGNDGRIEKKSKNPACGIAFLVLGIAVLIAGIRGQMSDSAQMALISIGAIAALVGGFLLVMLSISTCGGYRYRGTGACMKHYRRYVNAGDRQALLDCINHSDMSQLGQVRKETSTGTLLRAYVSKDGAFAVAQVEEYIPHDFVAMTPPTCLEGDAAKNLSAWLKA